MRVFLKNKWRASAFLWLLIMTSVPVMAQQLKVDGFTERTYDTSANAPETRKSDLNGDLCALIKVFAPPVAIESYFFDGGAKGITAKEIKGGEIWLYVPASSLQVTISHPQFGRIEYEYPEQLKKGSTYQMLLNVGGGRFITFNSQGVDKANIVVNGNSIGEAPIYNHYLPYGTYQVTATKNRFEGAINLVVEQGEGTQIAIIPMEDQTPHFGNVTITVDDPNAIIFLQGERKGARQTKVQLREGNYEVITRKNDCDDAVTQFTVIAQQENNVRANSPIPHTGSIQIYTRPRNVTATYDNNIPIDLTEMRVLPVGAHQFHFSRKGYVTLDHEVKVKRGELTLDTVMLEPVNYIKSKWAFYFGAGYTLSSLSGVTGYAGGVYNNIDLQLSYTLGLASSSEVTFNPSKAIPDRNTFKMNAFAAKLGYQIRLIPRIGITPQVGYMMQMLSSSAVDASSTKYCDGAKASCLTFGAKILAVPAHRIYLFVTPEYALPMSKDATFDVASSNGGFNAGGFSISAGLHLNIGK